MTRSNNRLTVLGSNRQVELFQQSNWERRLHAPFSELLEYSPGRFACQFETESAPLKSLRQLSRRWPRLKFLLDYEIEASRIKVLAKATGGQLEHHQIRY